MPDLPGAGAHRARWPRCRSRCRGTSPTRPERKTGGPGWRRSPRPRRCSRIGGRSSSASRSSPAVGRHGWRRRAAPPAATSSSRWPGATPRRSTRRRDWPRGAARPRSTSTPRPRSATPPRSSSNGASPERRWRPDPSPSRISSSHDCFRVSGERLHPATDSPPCRRCATSGRTRSSARRQPRGPGSTRDSSTPASRSSGRSPHRPTGPCCCARISTPGTCWPPSGNHGSSSTPSPTWAIRPTTRCNTC